MSFFFQNFAKTLGFLLGILVFLVFLVLLSSFLNKNSVSNFSYYGGNSENDEKIAIINLNGPIISNPANWYNYKIFKSMDVIYPSLLKNYLLELKKENILGLIISINSPGGSVSATNKIYNKIQNFKQETNIPIFFHTSDMLASGGYWFAMSGDKIFADYGAVIGSIGVKGPDWLYYNSPTSLSNGILGSSVESNNGIKLFSNTAGKSKDIFNPFRKPTQKEQEYLQEIVDDIYEDFANLVSSKRKIEKNIIKNEIGAMIFNTKKAQENFLIDSQKNIDQVTKYLLKELNDNTLQIINNSKTEGYNLLGINFIERMIFKDYENIANKKFCNNLLNEFSVILNNVKNTKC